MYFIIFFNDLSLADVESIFFIASVIGSFFWWLYLQIKKKFFSKVEDDSSNNINGGTA
ncbi:hypothetical protein [Psychroserpens mesophilus]|uniref:hypothetical protein n=1 Tax=Psychroserpens mesophilus TaxID=325473 RepID=UPI003D653C90